MGLRDRSNVEAASLSIVLHSLTKKNVFRSCCVACLTHSRQAYTQAIVLYFARIQFLGLAGYLPMYESAELHSLPPPPFYYALLERSKTRGWVATLKLNGQPFEFCIDTVVEATVIPVRT